MKLTSDRAKWCGLAAFVALAGCGGGGATQTSSLPLAPSGPTTQSSATNATVTTQSLKVALPTTAGISGSMTFVPAAIPASGVGLAMSASASRSPQASTGGQTVYEQISVVPTAQITYVPAFTVNLPAGVSTSGQTFYINASGTTPTPLNYTEGPATVSGTTLTFNPQTTPLTLNAGETYTLTLYSVPTASPVTLNDWPTYGYDNARDGYNPNTAAWTPANLGQAHLAWQASSGDFNTQTQPIIATNIGAHKAMLYVGGGSGKVYGYDATSGGSPVWTQQLTQASFQCPGRGTAYSGIAGSLAYDASAHAIFVASNKNNGVNTSAQASVYKLDPAGGGVLGSTSITPSPLPGELDVAHTSLTIANGYVYAGTSSPCDSVPWVGRVAAISESSLALANTTLVASHQGGPNSGGSGPYAGGGVWSWGGVSVDGAGNVYGDGGNTATGSSINSVAGFSAAPNEFQGYAEHVFRLSPTLAPISANYPGFQFGGSSEFDLDLAGTPVLYQPSMTCGTQAAAQGKSGQLFIYNTTTIGNGPLGKLQLSQDTYHGSFMGNPSFSPATGLLYANVVSAAGTLAPPGIVAITGCGSPTIAWSKAFGPDSYGYASSPPRSAPTATAGGILFATSPCSPNGSGGCGAASDANLHGAVWALDATSGTILNGGQPLFTTGDTIRMAPVVDGNWMWVIDQSGNLYAYTIDPSVPSATLKAATKSASSVYGGSRD